MHIAYTVKHCCPLPSGQYQIGAELMGVIDVAYAPDVHPNAIYAALLRAGGE
jgi:hypothetical protein